VSVGLLPPRETISAKSGALCLALFRLNEVYKATFRMFVAPSPQRVLRDKEVEGGRDVKWMSRRVLFIMPA